MRKNFGAKPICYPQPVFIVAAWGEDGTACAMNAAWGGITEADEITLCLSEEHKTTANILLHGAFTVSMADAKHVAECDYLGVVSGNDVPDKLSHIGFHVTQSEFVDAPVIDELPMALECKLKLYDKDSCRLIGKIINVNADESVLTNGVVDPAKLRPITFDPMNSAYLVVGERVGTAFSDGTELKRKEFS